MQQYGGCFYPSSSAIFFTNQQITGISQPLTVQGQKMAGIQVVIPAAATSGAITFDVEVSTDGVNFRTGALVTDVAGSDHTGNITLSASGAVVTEIYQILCAGINAIRVNVSANSLSGAVGSAYGATISVVAV